MVLRATKCSHLMHLLCVVLASALLVGCSNGPAEDLMKVSGTVTYQGKPVPNVSVTFTPEAGNGSGRPGSAITDASGAFSQARTYTGGDGLIPGSHKVTLATVSTGGDSTDIGEEAYAEESADSLPFPTKYLNTAESDVTVDISSAGQVLTIELTD